MRGKEVRMFSVLEALKRVRLSTYVTRYVGTYLSYQDRHLGMN